MRSSREPRALRQQADAEAVIWSYGYDSADQLTAAIQASTDPLPVILQRYAYRYDPAGNRTAEQIDDQAWGRRPTTSIG